MKEKVIIFLVGLLLGAIISTGSIYIYTVANRSNDSTFMQKPNDDMGSMRNDGNNPPEIPDNGANNANQKVN